MLLQRYSENDLFGPLHDMQRLQHTLNRLLSANSSTRPPEYPPINIWTSESGAIVRAEIPGVGPEDVDISLVNDTLTLRGYRRPEELNEGESRHRQERGYGQFARSIELPFGVEADHVEAKFSHGVLLINLPRAEAEKPRKISVLCES